MSRACVHIGYVPFVHRLTSAIGINAVVNGHIELNLLKGCRRFDAISTSNFEVFKIWDW